MKVILCWNFYNVLKNKQTNKQNNTTQKTKQTKKQNKTKQKRGTEVVYNGFIYGRFDEVCY